MMAVVGIPEIAVILCMYNSPYRKTLGTLISILKQEGPSFEVVLADDGSEYSIADDLLQDAKIRGFNVDSIKIARLPHNSGTVLNIANALRYVEAPVLTSISPGDYFYDAHVLKCYLEALQFNKVEIAFGRGLHYSLDTNLVIHKVLNPARWKRFDSGYRETSSAIRAIVEDYDHVLGTSLVYETSAFRTAIEAIQGHSVYVEDNTSIVAILLEGGRIAYIDRYVVWHEYGTGISTNGSNAWSRRIKEDFASAWQALLKLHPENKLLQDEVRRDLRFAANSLPKMSDKIVWRLLHLKSLPKWIDKKCCGFRYRPKDFSTQFFDSITRDAGLRAQE